MSTSLFARPTTLFTSYTRSVFVSPKRAIKRLMTVSLFLLS
jgi:hypothetical protein